MSSPPTSRGPQDPRTIRLPAPTSRLGLLHSRPERVLIAGWATDFCVDATVRSTVSNKFNVVVVADGHTLNDRPHLDAPSVIRHHHWVWSNLITNASIRVVMTSELLVEANQN